jgi:hypothetical protein
VSPWEPGKCTQSRRACPELVERGRLGLAEVPGSGRVPHVRPSVRGTKKMGEAQRTLYPVTARGPWESHISLVFREMWDSTAPHPQFPLCSKLRVSSEPITANLGLPYRGIFRNSAGDKARRVNRASRIAPLK